MSDPSASVVKCQCGVKLRVPPNAAGKRIRCPKCSYRIEVPADGAPIAVTTSATPPATAPAPRRPASPRPAAAPPPPADDSDSLLHDLLQSESVAATTAGPDLASKQKNCPSCNAAMTKDANVCLMCGHDLKARPASASAVTGKKTKAIAAGAARQGGKFLLGCVLSSVGALIGGLIWFGVAMATEREFGIIALAVGALAGGGMAFGNRTPSTLAGWVAVFTTVSGILFAKILIAAFVLYGVFTGDTNDIDEQREYVKLQMVEQRYEEEGIWSPEERLKKADDYEEKVEQEVTAWTNDEVRAKWKEFRDTEADSELDEKRMRIAAHRANLRVREKGDPPMGDEYQAYYNEEFSALKSRQPAELDASIAEVDAWENGGELADARNVRNRLVYEKAEAACDAEMSSFNWDDENADYDAKYAEAWKKHHAAAVAEVDGMAPEVQLTALKAIELQRDQEAAAAEAELAKRLEDVSGSEVALGVGAIVVIFIIFMFGIFGTIFTIIASVTAYRIAANGFAT